MGQCVYMFLLQMLSSVMALPVVIHIFVPHVHGGAFDESESDALELLLHCAVEWLLLLPGTQPTFVPRRLADNSTDRPNGRRYLSLALFESSFVMLRLTKVCAVPSTCGLETSLKGSVSVCSHARVCICLHVRIYVCVRVHACMHAHVNPCLRCAKAPTVKQQLQVVRVRARARVCAHAWVCSPMPAMCNGQAV